MNVLCFFIKHHDILYTVSTYFVTTEVSYYIGAHLLS